MFPPNLITGERVRAAAEVTSKKRLIEQVADLLATALPADTGAAAVFDRLVERERLGSTGLGQGVALPHARVSGISRPVGAFVQVRGPVPFDAADDRPVDLAFGLLVPDEATDEALALLAHLAGMFSDPALRTALREAQTPERLHALLTGWREPA